MRSLGWVLPLGLLASSACTGNATPDPTKCATTPQSVTFDTIGSCGDGTVHTVTISTNPGLCSLQLEGAGPATGLPGEGSFSGQATTTNYQIVSGNWSLHAHASQQGDPSRTDCDATPADAAGALTITCSINNCTPSGDDTGYSCAQSECLAHLTPHVAGAPDAGPPDAGADAAMDAPTDAGTDSPDGTDSAATDGRATD